MDLKDVRTLCKEIGIDLQGPDGQPFCCSQRMTVRGGIMGPDYAKCEKCGKTIGNMASPHINGGYIPDEKFFEDHPNNSTWVRLDSIHDESPERIDNKDG